MRGLSRKFVVFAIGRMCEISIFRSACQASKLACIGSHISASGPFKVAAILTAMAGVVDKFNASRTYRFANSTSRIAESKR